MRDSVESENAAAPRPEDRQSERDQSARPRVMAVVVNWKRPDLTKECVAALASSHWPELEILVVDNESDGTCRELLPLLDGQVGILERPTNLGFAGGSNAGMQAAIDAGADYVLVINNDCLPRPGFLDPLVAECEEHAMTGAAGPVLLSKDKAGGSWFNSGQRFDLARGVIEWDGHTGTGPPPSDGRELVGFLCGACVLFKVEALKDVGLFDPRLFLFGEEPDWAFRAARKGWHAVALAASQVDHVESTTTSTVPAARRYFVARNQAWIVRRHGTSSQSLVNAFRTLFWRMPKAVGGHLKRRDIDSAKGALAGSIDGLVRDCGRGHVPEDADSQRRFELRS